MASLKASFEASHAEYLARLDAGIQPLPPAAVRSVAGGALAFLDYTDDAALSRVNAVYLLLVALLYVVIRRRGTGFELRWLMIVRCFMPCRQASATLAPRVRLAVVRRRVGYGYHLRARAIWAASALAAEGRSGRVWACAAACRRACACSQVYNAVCVALAGYVVVGVVQYKLEEPGGFACNEPDLSPAGHRLARVMWCATRPCRVRPRRSRGRRSGCCTQRVRRVRESGRHQAHALALAVT